MLIFRSTLYALGMWLATLIYLPLIPVALVLPERPRVWLIARWAHSMTAWLELTCGLRCEVEGRENIPASNGIVMSNHQSAWETLYLQLVFHDPAWVLKRELLWVPVFGWGLALTRPIAIDRKAGRKAMQQVITQGRARLDSGRWVVIFPEGTRVAPGVHKPFNIGGAMLAAKSGYPVIPVAHNAGEYWPRRGFIKKPGTIRLVIGPVIETAGRGTADINRDAETWIRATMARISTLPADAAETKAGTADSR
jgi:1-acyl-sn-glycerol-3-phosphate acyltransferase